MNKGHNEVIWSTKRGALCSFFFFLGGGVCVKALVLKALLFTDDNQMWVSGVQFYKVRLKCLHGAQGTL